MESKSFSSFEEMKEYVEQINRTGKRLRWIPRTPLEQAQNLVYEALEMVGKKRIELVEQALKISPDCADAYVLLAEEKAQNLEQAFSLYEAGVKAAERGLGKKVFEEEAAHFWDMVETRPYMRARAGLAQCLWFLGRHQEAIGHYRELLSLNPNDNQGIRYLLAAALLETGQIATLEELLSQYDETSAAWLYTKALVTYVKEGDSVKARNLLKEALDFNPHVIAYLLAEKKLPRRMPEWVESGDKNEAIVYVAESGLGWHNTKGAINWLASTFGKARGTWQKRERLTGIPEVFLRAFESEDRKGRPQRQTENGQEE
jgi:tetratricopeptide (TPR) repeat protein